MSKRGRRSEWHGPGRIFGLLTLVIVVGAACADPAGPPRGDAPAGEPQEAGFFSTGEWIGGSWSVHSSETGEPIVLLHLAGEAPLLDSYEKTIVARYGERAVVRFRYAASSGDDDDDDDDRWGKTFLKFEVGALSLSHHPDGSPVLPGDEVQITVTIDPELLVATFEPAGLSFAPEHPAQLGMRYEWADPDTDDDGVEDLDESRIEIVGQEQPGEPWFRVEQTSDGSEDKIEAWLTGFTRYSLGI